MAERNPNIGSGNNPGKSGSGQPGHKSGSRDKSDQQGGELDETMRDRKTSSNSGTDQFDPTDRDDETTIREPNEEEQAFDEDGNEIESDEEEIDEEETDEEE